MQLTFEIPYPDGARKAVYDTTARTIRFLGKDERTIPYANATPSMQSYAVAAVVAHRQKQHGNTLWAFTGRNLV